MSIENKLSEMATARLVKIVLAALDTMEETEQIDFIAKHIDARTSLARLGADNPVAFLDEVENFCLDCLNETYYADDADIEAYFSDNDFGSSYYDDEWNYDEYFSNTKWAEIFSRLFKLSMMYIQGGDIETGYDANARLLACLKEMMADDRFLGTDDPMTYIDVDWNELFVLHYDALFKYHMDSEEAIEKAFRCWSDFGDFCTEGFLRNVKDIVVAERFILDGIGSACDWKFQRKCFELLEQLYVRLYVKFDKESKAKALIDLNVYFYLFVVEGLCEQENWQAAAETANIALAQIPMRAPEMTDWHQEHIHQEIRTAIQTKLVDAYENLADFTQAFKAASGIFQETPSFNSYKRARGLAAKTGGVSAFLNLVETHIGEEFRTSGYGGKNLLRDIYSYEGEVEKLYKMALSQNINRNYYDRKYVALSLIYRAANDAPGIGDNLSEYLTSAIGQDGITDMLKLDDDTQKRTELLLTGADLLRAIIAFHIDAAQRSRYAKAAYYMCVTRDIFIYLKREDEFKNYFRDVIMQNSRRPALRDEMSIVYGKQATEVKK